MKSNAKKTRTGDVRAIADLVYQLTHPLFSKRGLGNGAIIRDWKIIVGENIADGSYPVRLSRSFRGTETGTLLLHVLNGGISLKLQHLEPIIIEKINTYLGYNAISRLKFIQAPFKKISKKKSGHKRKKIILNKEINYESTFKAPQSIVAVDDIDVRNALAALGASVFRRCAQKNKPD